MIAMKVADKMRTNPRRGSVVRVDDLKVARKIVEPGGKVLIVLNKVCVERPALPLLLEPGMQLTRRLNIPGNAQEVCELPCDLHFRIIQTGNRPENAKVNRFRFDTKISAACIA